MADESLPRYVIRSGESCHQQPASCSGTQLFGFFIKADAPTMQRRLVDPCLNAPSAGKTDYRVISNHVMVTYAYAAQGRSTLPPDNQIGFIPERSWTVWVPTAAVKKELGVFVAERLAFYAAYISVDNPWSTAEGREVYGFPKGCGPIEMPLTVNEPKHFSASSIVLKKYSPDEQATQAVLMDIRPTVVGEGLLGEAWADVESVFKAVVHLWSREAGPWIVPGPDLAIDVFGLLRHEEVPSVFFKQIRDAIDGTRACYQAVIEAMSSVTKFHSGGLLPGKFVANVADFDSHPLCRDLGLQSATVPAEFPFWTNFDFTIGLGTEIWKANSNA